jgi:ACS family hexuronate transporter-like MFS transporter
VIATVFSPLGILAVFAHSLFWTIALISVAIYFWMFWSITIHSLPGDFFPPRAVASVYGIGGTGSTIGSVIATWAVGRTLDTTHSYAPVFIGLSLLLAGTALMGRIEPVNSAAYPLPQHQSQVPWS